MSNSTEDYYVKKKLVDREVIYNVSMMVDHFLRNSETLEGSDHCWEDLMPSMDWEAAAKDEGLIEVDDEIHQVHNKTVYGTAEQAGKQLGFFIHEGYVCHENDEVDNIEIIYEDDDGAFEEAILKGNDSLKAVEVDGGFIIVDEVSYSDWEEACKDNGIYEREPLEYWIVTEWFADNLEAHGEPIIRDFLNMTIWGRCTSGQSIVIDGVVDEIASEMGILEGQIRHNNWRV